MLFYLNVLYKYKLFLPINLQNTDIHRCKLSGGRYLKLNLHFEAVNGYLLIFILNHAFFMNFTTTR